MMCCHESYGLWTVRMTYILTSSWGAPKLRWWGARVSLRSNFLCTSYTPSLQYIYSSIYVVYSHDTVDTFKMTLSTSLVERERERVQVAFKYCTVHSRVNSFRLPHSRFFKIVLQNWKQLINLFFSLRLFSSQRWRRRPSARTNRSNNYKEHLANKKIE